MNIFANDREEAMLFRQMEREENIHPEDLYCQECIEECKSRQLEVGEIDCDECPVNRNKQRVAG